MFFWFFGSRVTGHGSRFLGGFMAYSGGRSEDRGPKPITSQIGPEEQISSFRRLVDLIESHAPQEKIAEAQKAVAESLGKDQFQIMRMLPHFIQAAAKNVDAATVYEHFRLPGRDRIVHDRREEGKGGAEKDARKKERARGEQRLEFEIKKGRLVKFKEKTYENYLADRMGKTVSEREAAEAKVQRLLSVFEELIVSRFEGGRQVAKESPDGKPRFLVKTEGQWKDFFSKFYDRIVAKKVLLQDIHEFLFRGLVPKGNKGVVISDMILNNGRVEKFVRFSVIADALARLKALMPGDSFGRERLAGLTGEEFLYLALAVSKGRDIAMSPLPTAGKFVSGQAEEKAAQELGLPIPGQPQGRAASLKGRTRRAPFMGLFDEHEGEPEELPYQFIPWWHWANLKRPVRSRWATVAFYTALLAMALMGIGILTYRLLSGGL